MLKKIFDFIFSPIYLKILNSVSCNIFISERVRLGRPHDGGYVILPSTFKCYKNLLSFGICNDVSFEKEFASQHSNSKIYCFDPSITQMPEPVDRASFYPIGIDDVSTGAYLSLPDILHKISRDEINLEDTFLKMDIEGYEWKVFNDKASYDVIKQIDQIAIELHFKTILKGSKFRLPVELIKRYLILKKIKKDFYVYNLHANNATANGSYTYFSKFIFPHIAEVSLINKRNINMLVKDINQSCDPSLPDVQNFYI